MAVGRPAEGGRRGCWCRRCRDGADWRAALGGRSKRLRVGKAVGVAKTFRRADVPGEQVYVLQVVRCCACMSDEGLRCGKVVLGVRIGGFEKEVGGGEMRAAAT